ncbi:heavy metal-binding domain-containing protein [Frondihabitans cladoniiphilus]|uniref:Heavy metal-binding domain-containing protein n=1 Tax=Frondihabitans cladoniiphilus TaxID=715785 RepID=A0ABP8WCI0_9MICO
MSDWIDGLPPAAHERIARQRASSTSGSLLSAPAAAALRSSGLAPVGEVFGCLVMQLGWTMGGCGAYGSRGFGTGGFGMLGGGYTTPVTTSGGSSGKYGGFGPYVKAFEKAWYGAVDRMLTEARALGAEGVVGVQVTRKRMENSTWEFTAIGTAVRSVDTALMPRPSRSGEVWYAGLSAEDCAAAILSGLVPRGLVLGISVATKHEDYQLKMQRNSWSNTEVDGLTLLLQAARKDARAQLAARASRVGGSDLVISHSFVGEFETPCGEEKDLHAEAIFVGTVLGPGPMADFRTHKRPGTAAVMTVMPLTDPPSRRR